MCAKGLAESNLSGGGSCSLCRMPIDKVLCTVLKQSLIEVCFLLTSNKILFYKLQNFFRNRKLQVQDNSDSSTDEKYWFYEGGKSGWWKFDERSNLELEKNYSEGVESFDFLICGNLYVIDFKTMIQYRKDGSGRIRKLRRGDKNVLAKGIAGQFSC